MATAQEEYNKYQKHYDREYGGSRNYRGATAGTRRQRDQSQRTLDDLRQLALKERMGIVGPQQAGGGGIAANGAQGTSTAITGPLPEFDIARKRVKSDYLGAYENMKDAMSRRFARIGGGPSGSQIKMEAEQGGKLEEARQKTEEGLLMDELQTKQKIRALDQVDRQFELDKRISEFNMHLAEMEAKRPTDLFGSLFGSAFSLDPNQGSVFSIPTKVVSKIFCFVAGTRIKMIGGEEKNIKDIDIGDQCLGGGRVYMVGKSESQDIYDYNGVLVTGSHAVLEGNEFIRVQDSKKSIPYNTKQKVYFISNDNHRIMIGETLFSDYDETDIPDLTERESLQRLNEYYREMI